MPFRAPAGKCYHLKYQCSPTVTLICGTEGLVPCTKCCTVDKASGTVKKKLGKTGDGGYTYTPSGSLSNEINHIRGLYEKDCAGNATLEEQEELTDFVSAVCRVGDRYLSIPELEELLLGAFQIAEKGEAALATGQSYAPEEFISAEDITSADVRGLLTGTLSAKAPGEVFYWKQPKSEKESSQAAENRVRNLFYQGATFEYEGHSFKVVYAGKPKRHGGSGGEPKTDIFVLAHDEHGEPRQFKITYKKKDYDFVENHMNKETLEAILEKRAEDLLSQLIKSKHLLYQSAAEKTLEEGKIPLGWQIVIRSHTPNQNIASSITAGIKLEPDEAIRAYSGCNAIDDFKDADVKLVEGDVIEQVADSGIAEYICIEDPDNKYTSAQDVMNDLIRVEDYALEHGAYLSCQAANVRYSTDKHKWTYDANRPLGVYIDYQQNEDGGWQASIIMAAPFEETTNKNGQIMNDWCKGLFKNATEAREASEAISCGLIDDSNIGMPE